MDNDQVQRYADAIMALIHQDIASGTVPTDVSTFSQLHDHVDANGYADQVGIPWGNGNYDLVNTVEDRVSEMLQVAAAQRRT